MADFDFQEIYETIMFNCHEPTSNTTLLTQVKLWVNQRYHKVWSRMTSADPAFGRAESVLTTVADYTDGTVEVDGTTTVTGTDTTFTSAMVGRKFKLNSFNEVYEISAYVSATEITLNKACNADADDELGYIIYDDELTLPTDCEDIVSLGQYRTPKALDRIGLGALRAKQLDCPISVEPVTIQYPKYYAYLTRSTIVLYPAPIEVIIMQLDYTKKFTRLSDDDSVPLIPVDNRGILVTGGMADLKKYKDDSDWQTEEQLFEKQLNELIGRSALETDFPSIKPYVYRS